MNCKFCGLSSVVKNGMKNGSQRYLCKGCRHKFYDNGNSFAKMRTPTHVIVSALNMYFQGLSVRKVSEELSEIFGEEISQVSIWSWVQKYSRAVADYVETLPVNLSGKYHHDETEISIGGQSRWFWETIDEDTRFLVAHHVSANRSTEEAKKVFSKALAKQRPIALFTDGSFTYDGAFSKVFYTRYKASRVGKTPAQASTCIRSMMLLVSLALIPTLLTHSTLKDRLSPMHGLKHNETAQTLLDGFVAYYNFCRTHQSTGIEVKGWKELIEKAKAQETKKEIEGQSQIVMVKN